MVLCKFVRGSLITGHTQTQQNTTSINTELATKPRFRLSLLIKTEIKFTSARLPPRLHCMEMPPLTQSLSTTQKPILVLTTY
uniref:Ovule protein n=1 Tax=Mesocestoides corti TaxID=53468 RepID=A0A5K3EM30_MESCO